MQIGFPAAYCHPTPPFALLLTLSHLKTVGNARTLSLFSFRPRFLIATHRTFPRRRDAPLAGGCHSDWLVGATLAGWTPLWLVGATLAGGCHSGWVDAPLAGWTPLWLAGGRHSGWLAGGRPSGWVDAPLAGWRMRLVFRRIVIGHLFRDLSGVFFFFFFVSLICGLFSRMIVFSSIIWGRFLYRVAFFLLCGEKRDAAFLRLFFCWILFLFFFFSLNYSAENGNI